MTATAIPYRQPAEDVRLGILLMIGGIVLFVVGETLVKLLAARYDVSQVVWARYTFHMLITVLLFSRGNVLRQARSSRPFLHLARSGLMLAATLFFFSALHYLPLADAVAINFVAPLLVTVLSIPLLGERVGPRRWCAIAVGLAGVLIIIRPGSAGMHWASVLPLGAAGCYALYQVLTRIASRTDDTGTSLFYTSAFGVAAMSVAVPFFWTDPDLAGWTMMAALGCVYGLGHWLVIRGLERAPASMLSPFLYTQIIWATLFGLLVFGNFPDAPTWLGMAVVIGSGIYVWKRETGR